MPGAVRDGDINAGGGVAMGGAGSVYINGDRAGQPGMFVTPHFPCSPKAPQHCIAFTTGGAATVSVEGAPLLRQGDKDSCGHARMTGSSDVLVGR